MKAITISIDEDLDRRAAAEARRRGMSKSELVREGLACVLPAPVAEHAPADVWAELGGFGESGLTSSPGEIDEVVYGQ